MFSGTVCLPHSQQIWEEFVFSAHPIPLRGHYDYKQRRAVVLIQDSPPWLGDWQNNGLQWAAQTSVSSWWIMLTPNTEQAECSISVNLHKKCQGVLKLSLWKPIWKSLSVNIFIHVSARILICSRVGLWCCHLC